MIEKRLNKKTIANPRGGEGSMDMVELLQGDVLESVTLLGIITLHPGSSIGNHQHLGEAEIYYVLDGEGVFDDNGLKSKVSSGDFCIIEPGESHGIFNSSFEKPLLMVACVYKGYKPLGE